MFSVNTDFPEYYTSLFPYKGGIELLSCQSLYDSDLPVIFSAN